MIIGILIYFMIFILTLYWFFVFNDTVLAFVLVLEVVYFFFSVMFCLMIKRKIKFSMGKLVQTAEKNQEIPVSVVIHNHSKIFPGYFCLCFRFINTLTGEKTKFKVRGAIGRNRNKTLMVPMSVNSCGTVMIMLEKVKIYDLFMLVGINKRIKHSVQVKILPELHLIPMEITRKTRDFIADADEYSDRESGDDPSEVYQIREYNSQDSIHDIHWKLSAKSENLLVKERGKSLGSAVLIWIDTSTKGTKKTGKKRHIIRRKKQKIGVSPDILEIAVSISFSLFESECVHTVAWYEAESGTVKKKRVSKEMHIYEMLNRITLIRICEDKENMDIMYREAFRGENFSTIVEIESDGVVLVNGTQVEIPGKIENIIWEQLALTV